jgi:hypothetical protein
MILTPSFLAFDNNDLNPGAPPSISQGVSLEVTARAEAFSFLYIGPCPEKNWPADPVIGQLSLWKAPIR